MLLSVHKIWGAAWARAAEYQRRRPRMAYFVPSVLVTDKPRPHSWSFGGAGISAWLDAKPSTVNTTRAVAQALIDAALQN